MSDDRPSPALGESAPLHSILSGFSEPDDDVLADFACSDEATVAPGLPRHVSSGRPLDEDREPPLFAPPIPALRAEEVAGALSIAGDARPARRRPPYLRAVAALAPALRRPSPKVVAAVAGLAVVAAVATSRESGPSKPMPDRAADDRELHPQRSPQLNARRRGRTRRIRPRPVRVQRARRTRAPVSPGETRPRTPTTKTAAATAPSGTRAATPLPPGSRFTAEFTP